MPCVDRVHTRMLYRISPLASESRLRSEMDKAFRAALILKPDDDIASLSNSFAGNASILNKSWPRPPKDPEAWHDAVQSPGPLAVDEEDGGGTFV